MVGQEKKRWKEKNGLIHRERRKEKCKLIVIWKKLNVKYFLTGTIHFVYDFGFF